MQTEEFPEHTLGAVAKDRAAMFSTDGKPQMPGPGVIPYHHDQYPLRSDEAAAMSVASAKIQPPPKAETGGKAQTAKRLRPLARRRLMIARPFLVRMRTKKPCVRFRRVVLGWYVLFITVLLWKKVKKKTSRKMWMRQERCTGAH